MLLLFFAIFLSGCALDPEMERQPPCYEHLCPSPYAPNLSLDVLNRSMEGSILKCLSLPEQLVIAQIMQDKLSFQADQIPQGWYNESYDLAGVFLAYPPVEQGAAICRTYRHDIYKAESWSSIGGRACKTPHQYWEILEEFLIPQLGSDPELLSTPE